MRILIFTQYYPPEVGATQNRMHAFATHLADVGHNVSVIAHVPNHPKGEIFPEYRRISPARHKALSWTISASRRASTRW